MAREGTGGRACGKGGGGPGWGGWKTCPPGPRQGTPRQGTWATSEPSPQGQKTQHRQKANKPALPGLSRVSWGVREGPLGGAGAEGTGFWCGPSKVPEQQPTAPHPMPGGRGGSELGLCRDAATGDLSSAICRWGSWDKGAGGGRRGRTERKAEQFRASEQLLGVLTTRRADRHGARTAWKAVCSISSWARSTPPEGRRQYKPWVTDTETEAQRSLEKKTKPPKLTQQGSGQALPWPSCHLWPQGSKCVFTSRKHVLRLNVIYQDALTRTHPSVTSFSPRALRTPGQRPDSNPGIPQGCETPAPGRASAVCPVPRPAR